MPSESATEREKHLIERKKYLGWRSAHAPLRAAYSLREEYLSAFIAAALFNPASRPPVLNALGISHAPESLLYLHPNATPVDLALGFSDPEPPSDSERPPEIKHWVFVEVKNWGSNSNYPLYRRAKREGVKARSQTDRMYEASDLPPCTDPQHTDCRKLETTTDKFIAWQRPAWTEKITADSAKSFLILDAAGRAVDSIYPPEAQNSSFRNAHWEVVHRTKFLDSICNAFESDQTNKPIRDALLPLLSIAWTDTDLPAALDH